MWIKKVRNNIDRMERHDQKASCNLQNWRLGQKLGSELFSSQNNYNNNRNAKFILSIKRKHNNSSEERLFPNSWVESTFLWERAWSWCINLTLPVKPIRERTLELMSENLRVSGCSSWSWVSHLPLIKQQNILHSWHEN